MDRPPAQVVQALQEMETAAEDVLADKENSIQLDRRRQQTREALRSLQKKKKEKGGSGGEEEKVFLCYGNMFIKMPRDKATTLLKNNFEQLDDEIDEIRRTLKQKVNRLRDIEDKDELKGFHLNGLSKTDLESVEGLI